MGKQKMSDKEKNQPPTNGRSWITAIIVAGIAALGYILVALINRSATLEAALKPIEATQTAEAYHTEIAMMTQSHVISPTAIPLSETDSPTSDITPIFTTTPKVNQPLPTLIAGLICIDNLMKQPWHLEATADVDEDWTDFSDQYILQGKDILRITYNLHGLMAQEGERKNDSAIVFTQPDWYGINLANYGINGFDGEQTVDIPLADFLELPNPDENIIGGKQLDFNEPVSSIRARFWFRDHFVVDIISISICRIPK